MGGRDLKSLQIFKVKSEISSGIAAPIPGKIPNFTPKIFRDFRMHLGLGLGLPVVPRSTPGPRVLRTAGPTASPPSKRDETIKLSEYEKGYPECFYYKTVARWKIASKDPYQVYP